MIGRAASAANWVDDLTDADIPDSVGRVALIAGNVSEIALVTALAGTELRTRSLRGLARIASPMIVERLTVFASDQLVDRDRPKQPSNRPGDLSPSSSSFPSGHASNAFLSATLVSGKVPAALAYGLATVVAVTRVIMRVHHPTDVIAGAIAGVAIGRAMNSLVPPDE